MKNASEKTQIPDLTKRRVIIIQRGISSNSGDDFGASKRQQPLIENLKQNADTNNPIEESIQSIQKQQLQSLHPINTENIQPLTEITPVHFEMIYSSLFQLRQQIFNLTHRLENIEKRLEKGEMKQESDHQVGLRKKRRKAEQIIKSYICDYPSCKKAYGSQMSLNLHMKIKHQAKIQIPQAQQYVQDTPNPQSSSKNQQSPLQGS